MTTTFQLTLDDVRQSDIEGEFEDVFIRLHQFINKSDPFIEITPENIPLLLSLGFGAFWDQLQVEYNTLPRLENLDFSAKVYPRIYTVKYPVNGCNFDSAEILAGDFEDTIFNDCTFNGTIFTALTTEHSKFFNCEFNNTTFRRCVPAGTSFEQCKFENCIFESCELRYSKWVESSLIKTQLISTVFTGCSFMSSVLEELSFEKVKFMNTVLRNCEADVNELMKMGYPPDILIGAKSLELNHDSA